MKPNRLFALAMVAAAVSLVAQASQAAIVSYDFADPVAEVPSSAYAICDGSGQDRCGTTLAFEKDGLTVTASVLVGAVSAGIIQDLSPDLGGLGIVDSFDAEARSHEGNDNVSVGETILLHFDVPVFLYTVGFFDDHESLPHSFPDGSNFFFSVDGSPYVSYSLAGALGAGGRLIDFGGLSGSDFAFKHAGLGEDDFYIATVVADPVPEPGTLLLLGSGILGLAGRARRRTRG